MFVCVPFLSPQRAVGDLGVLCVCTAAVAAFGAQAACLGHGQRSIGSGEVGRARPPPPLGHPESAGHLRRSHTGSVAAPWVLMDYMLGFLSFSPPLSAPTTS